MVVLAHGTASAAGRAVLEQTTHAAATTLGLAPRLGYVDVCEPTAAQVLLGLEAPVVVPLFLASGYHVRTDIPAAVAAVPGAVAAPAVGSGPGIVDALVDRVRAVEASPEAVILTGAGSSDAEARAEVEHAATLLAEKLGVPARHAFLSGSPTAPEAYADVGGRVVVASHLLAPGYFQGLLERAAADLGFPATAPIGSHPNVAATIVARYRERAGA